MVLEVLGEKYKLNKESLQRIGILGQCSSATKIILVDKELKGDAYYETLLHELGHAVFAESSLNQAIDDKLEEIVVDVISRVIVKNFNLTPKRKR